ncbi:MAG TPA: AIPR family protein [Leptospiraceae bacterium]|nr:AIPR family protein [Leptospiraceae bacterium]HMX33726.1 AIPR family protein [Leptospiraceae bacterium]HMY33225.1 AIPR family protein [Leptospiraceae bacterium]HMZ65095.1 AIPR family protein [Leptospiraceae bacterium]HNA08757.1 AIPR family protein [Leptospiraceae bacterium]
MLEIVNNYETFKNEWLAPVLQKGKNPERTGSEFGRKLFSQWFEIDEDSADFFEFNNHYTLGVDLAYYHEGSDEEENSNKEFVWYLIYSDLGDALKNLDSFESYYDRLIQTIKNQKFITKEDLPFQQNLKSFLTKASKANEKLSYKIAIVLALSDEQKWDDYDFVRQYIHRKEQPDSINIDVEIISIRTIYNRILEERNRTDIFDIKANLVESGSDLLVGSIKLIDLYNFLKVYKKEKKDLDLIYQKNVRKYLGSRNKVNSDIRRTIIENPESFGLYNNGVTIVAADYDYKKGEETNLIEPYIVNGCQTSKTIWATLEYEFANNTKNPHFHDWEKKLNSSTVVLKIVKIGDITEDKNSAELLKSITRFTNSQNAVKATDFISLEESFNRFHAEMADKYNIYLEIQRGGWDSRRALQKLNPTILPFFRDDDYANAFELIKVFASGWLKRPALAYGKNPPFAPGGSIFKQITDKADKNYINIEDLYASFLLQKEANFHKFGSVAELQSRKQTRHFFYFIVIEILRDIIYKAFNKPTNEKEIITKSLIQILKNESAKSELIENAALPILEDYMTETKEHSIFREEEYKNDLNSFLKNDKWVGTTSNFKFLVSVQLSTMKRAYRGVIPYNLLLDEVKKVG